MTERKLLLTLMTCVVLILVSSWLTQRWYDLHPCLLCKLERLVYVLVLCVGTVGLWRTHLVNVATKVIGCLFIGGLLASLYHVAIQQGLLPSPSFCLNTLDGSMMTAAELREHLLNTHAAPCHVVEWSLFGISLAGYNALISAVLTIITFSLKRNANVTR